MSGDEARGRGQWERLLRDAESIVDGTGRRALLSIEEGGDATIAREQLEALGFDVFDEEGARGALRALESRTSDVIVADVTRWSPADRAVLWFLCAQSSSGLVLMGPPGERTAELAGRVGVDYLARPVEPRRLVDAVSRAVRRADPETRAESGEGELDEGEGASVPLHGKVPSVELDYRSVDDALREEDFGDLIEAAEAAAGAGVARGGDPLPADVGLGADEPETPSVRDESPPARWRRFAADVRRRVRPETPRSDRFAVFLDCCQEHLQPAAAAIAELMPDGVRLWLAQDAAERLRARGGSADGVPGDVQQNGQEDDHETWARLAACVFRRTPPPSVVRVPVGSESSERGVLVLVFERPTLLAPRQLEELRFLLTEIVRL